jgi:hypothetical protein
MKHAWIILLLLLVLILLIWLFVKPFNPPVTQLPIRLTGPGGQETTQFQMHDSILFEAFDLAPRTTYDVRITRDDGQPVQTLRLSTDNTGVIPETVLWYNAGMYSHTEIPGDTLTASNRLGNFDISDQTYAGRQYKLAILLNGATVRETVFEIAKDIFRPRLYAATAKGLPKSGFLIAEEDIWVIGRNFPKSSVVKLWIVDADSDWREPAPLEDVTRQYPNNQPAVFELTGNQTSFRKRLWPQNSTSVGSYDIVAEVITYPFGAYRARASASVQNVVSNLSYSGFVIQRRQGVGEPLEMNIAGAVSSPFAFRDTFLSTENVYVGVDPAVQPSYIGQTADVYIVADKTDAQWTANTSLTDVTGGVETITVGGICSNCWKTLAWAAPLTPGHYDVVLDFNQDGQYSPGTDLIDGLDPIGFTVSSIRVDTISFNYAGSGAVTIYDKSAGSNVSAPEYVSAGHVIQPAAWIMNSAYSVEVTFKAVNTVNSAQIWAQGDVGGLNSSAAPVAVNFAGGTGQGTFSVNSVPALIDKHLIEWDWKYKNLNGALTAAVDMGSTGEHIVYTVLAAPQAPQTTPWLDVLDIACDLAQNRNNASDATRDIWDDFYNNAGGSYDTVSGAPRYASSKFGGNFDLTTWLANYDSASIGIVNCYDMAASVLIFANALGCSAQYTYVGPFGYLNCVKPIGKGWANNPFYDNLGYNSNPIVNGDWSSADGRSSFGNHAFTRVGNNIYDGSGGKVDVDGDPDGVPHTTRNLDGNDTWQNNYRNRVIDDNPVSNPANPTDHNVSVY